MQRLRATRATTPSRGFITRAASALMFIGATALAIALPGDAAAERDSITPSFNEWRESGSPAPNEGHWLDSDIGTFRITRGDGLQDRVFRAWQKRVHQEPERAAREIHSMLIGGSEGRDKLRQMLLNAAEGNEMVTSLELDAWWESYSRSYLLDLADSGVEEILAYGEERMRERLGFVRNVNLEYRTPLGGRTGYGALSFVGPLQEGADDVIAWQMRASHNEDAETGANLGLIYRQARDHQSGHQGTPMLLGVNAFLDFETHQAGNFLRYSIGGEIRTGTIDFYGNYYVPLTDPRVDNDGTTYYSAEGLDVEANIGVPSADWLSAVLGYYWWDGEGPHDGEQGQKIGLRARPNSLWEIELEYDWADDRQDEFGGRLSYSRQIGEHPTFTASSRPFGGNFNPRNHFYDIVRREYSHRIRSYGGVGDPVIIPSASDVRGVAVFSGVATLDASNTGVNASVGVSYPLAASGGTSTVNVTAGEALVALGFGNDTPAGTIGFMAGEYVIDVAARAIIVNSGIVFWDDPRTRWADNFGFGVEGTGTKSGSTVILTGTGFEGNATAGTFVLYEGNGEASDVAAPDTAISLRCDQSSPEGRIRSGSTADSGYTTECYGDLATDSTGLVLGGTALEAGSDYPNPDETQLAASGAAMFLMRGGRGRGIGETAATYSPQIAFTGENTVAIKNDVAGGERYIKGSGFSIDGGAIGCDHTSQTVLRYVGGVAAYCQSGLDAFTQTDPPAPVGVANTDFASGGILLTVGNPDAIAGVGGLYAVVMPSVGFSLDDSGVLSADSAGISNLTDGANDVIVNQRIGVIPGSGLPEERMIDLNVHKLSDTGAQVVILIKKDPTDTALTDNDIYPNGRGVTGDNLGFVFEDVSIEGVDTAGLTVANVAYDRNTNQFTIDQELTEAHISDNFIVVTMTASNVRGTHIMTVNVGVVDRIVIRASEQVSPNENIAAAANYAGPIAEAAGLVNSAAQGNVTFQCNVVGGDTTAFSASPTATGCSANLNTPIGDAANSRAVQIEVVHTATPSYTQELLAPFNGQQPDGSGNTIADTVITANITVWKAEADTQYANANSDSEVAGVSFVPPANPDASVDFQSGGSWGEETLGADFENLVIGADGSISGSVSDRPGDDADLGIYILTMTANFMHRLLAGELPVGLELTVSDFSAPTTLTVSAADAFGNVIVRVNNGDPLTVDTTATEVTTASNRDIIEISAVPNSGYHVSLWTSTGDIDVCQDANLAGHGGVKTCVLPNRMDHGFIILQVAFGAGALHPDLAETGAVVAGRMSVADICHALLGRVNDGAASDTCQQYTANSAASTDCILSGGGTDCHAPFDGVRNCNLMNRPASDVTFLTGPRRLGEVTCGSVCDPGEAAVGGQCVAMADPRDVSYSVTGGAIQAYRALDGSPVANGGVVSHGALLSVVATPNAGHYVPEWPVACENDVLEDITITGVPSLGGSSGNLDDTSAKFCHVRATVDIAISGFAMEQVPAGYTGLPDVPDGASGLAPGADPAVDGKTLCESYGGTLFSGDSGDLCVGMTKDVSDPPSEFDPNCAFTDPVTFLPNCGYAFRSIRECNLQRRTAENLNRIIRVGPNNFSVAECSENPCPAGQYAVGGQCRGSLFFQNLAARGLAVGNGEGKGESSQGGGFFFHPRTAVAASEISGNPGARETAPDALPPEIPTGSEDVPNTQEICAKFLGTYEPILSGDGACAGIASADPFCVLGTPDCQRLFNRVRTCNLEENRVGGNAGACGDPCPAGLSAIGSECAVEFGGVPAATLTVGTINQSIAADPDDVENTQVGCAALLGKFEPILSGDGACAGVAQADPFCVLGTPDCQRLFNRVRTCNEKENRRGGNAGACGQLCLHGSIARGEQCIAPEPADGIQITEPPVERGSLSAMSDGNVVSAGFTELVQDQVVTITASPVAGYYLARWTGNCANAETDGNSATSASSVAYSPDDQTCILQRSGANGTPEAALSAGAVFEYGLLPSAVRQYADATHIPQDDLVDAHCTALGGRTGTTLAVTYCDDYNEDTDPPVSVGGETIGDEEDENIEDQCWLSGGSANLVPAEKMTRENIQLCSNALAHAIQCNKLNMRSASNLPMPVSQECETTGTSECAALPAARAVNSPSAELLCGGACEANEIARGGNCVSATAASNPSDTVGADY